MQGVFQRLVVASTTLLLITCLPFLSRGQTTITISGPDTVCKGEQASYSIATSSGVNYLWSVSALGSVNPLNGPSVTVYWAGAGSATVQVEGRDSNNVIVETGTINVAVLPPPEPELTWDAQVGCQVADSFGKERVDEDIEDGRCLRVCEHSIVTYSVTNPSSGGSFFWQVTGGNIIGTPGITCTVSWGAAGQGAISVTDTNSYGCYGTTYMCIEKIPGPRAEFTMLPFAVGDHFQTCVDKINIFQDLSSQGAGTPIVSWYWDFGDGTTSPLPNPTHAYTNDGTYNVTLTVTNACNCSNTFEYKVEVLKGKGVTVTCPSVVCENQIGRYWAEPFADFKDCLNDGSAWWEAVGGSIVNQQDNWVDVVWDHVDSLGFGYLIFHMTPDCKYPCPTPTVVKIPVVQDTGYIQGPEVICSGTRQYTYKMPQWPATVFNWTMNTGTGATLIPTDQPNEYIIQTTNPGIIELRVDYENTLLFCTGFATKRILVTSPPTVSGPETVCSPGSATYSLSGGHVGNWTLSGPSGPQYGVGNSFNANFTSGGNYTLTVWGNGFCAPEPLDIEVLHKPAMPDSLLGPDTVCAATPYLFNAKNSDPNTIFRWAVTGGSFSGSSSGNNVSISFNSGLQTIKLWRELKKSPYCASDTLYKTVYPPVVHVQVSGPDTVCASTYQNYSAGYQEGELYEWEIINSTTGSVTTANPGADIEVLWNHVTTPTDALLIAKVRKCGVLHKDTLLVHVIPTVNLTIVAPDTVCRDEVFGVSFLPSLTSYGSVAWAFGDGGGSILPSDFYDYDQLNGSNTTYTITLNVTQPNGCHSPATATHDIVVKPAPVANVTPAGPYYFCDTAANLPMLLTATIQSGFGTTSSVEWYRNGVYQASGISFNALYTGTYYAIVTNTNGCEAKTNEVKINYFCSTPCVVTPSPTVQASGVLSDCGEVSLTGSYYTGGFSPNWGYPQEANPVSVGANTAVFTFTKAGRYEFTYSVLYNGVNGVCVRTDTAIVTVPFIAGLKYSLSCGSTPGTYQVSLLDHSNYYPATPITNWNFFINGVSVQNTSLTSYTTSLAPGSYPIALAIYNNAFPSYDTCWAFDTLVVPNLPVANFSYAPDTIPEICIGYPVQFTSIAYPLGVTHFWSFDDASHNAQQHPERVYASPGTYFVSLQISDSFGCTDDTTVAIKIHSRDLDGEIDPVGALCEGEPANLNYVNSILAGSPTDYYWIKDNDTIFNTTYNPVGVFETGSWWVSVSDQYYCSFTTNAVPVEFTMVPDAEISGDTNYCHQTDFTLYGYAGPDVTVYEWYRDGTLVGNQSELFQSGLPVGSYDYQLIIRVQKPGGGYCSDTSALFTVHVNNPPPIPSISFSMLDCDLYKVELQASNGVPGSYTWSNGMSGNPINVYSGGPYKVYFHDGSGCVTSSQIDVPKDPEEYLWVFPSGCYKLCKELMAQGNYTLYGPTYPFNFWEWANAYYTENGGWYVNPYVVSVDGWHNLTLDNGLCKRTSDNMDVKAVDCRCDLKLEIHEIWMEHDDRGNCLVFVKLYIDNPYPFPISVTLSSPDGNWTPSTLVVPPGGSGFVVNFQPDPGFNGGSTMLYAYAQIVTEEGIFPCFWEREIEFPDLCQHFKYRQPEDAAGEGVTGADADRISLRLAPNPAVQSTKVHYQYGNGQFESRQIEVFDLTGRKVRSFNVADASGSLQLDMSDYAGGVYIVVMKEDGALLQHQKLTITR